MLTRKIFILLICFFLSFCTRGGKNTTPNILWILAEVRRPRSIQGRVLLGPKKEAEREYVFAAADRLGETFFKSRGIRGRKYHYIRNYNQNLSVNSSATAYRRAMDHGMFPDPPALAEHFRQYGVTSEVQHAKRYLELKEQVEKEIK